MGIKLELAGRTWLKNSCHRQRHLPLVQVVQIACWFTVVATGSSLHPHPADPAELTAKSILCNCSFLILVLNLILWPFPIVGLMDLLRLSPASLYSTDLSRSPRPLLVLSSPNAAQPQPHCQFPN